MFRFVLVAGLAALVKASSIPSNEPITDEGIVGGRNTTIEEYPYQLALEWDQKYFQCGASLIKPNVALTAAHCTTWLPVSSYRIRAGSTYIGKGGALANVLKIYNHPKYNTDTLDYDVSVLILDRSFSLSASIQTISLQSVGVEAPEGAVATATGWGALNNQWEDPLTLQAVEIPKVSHQKCAASYKPVGNEVTERMICYGYTEETKGVCKGDSGGPIVVNKKLAGIASWTKGGCAKPGYPSVFAKISNKEITYHVNKYIAGF